VALRRSGLTSTAVTVIEALGRSGSRHLAALQQLGQQMAQLLPDPSWRWWDRFFALGRAAPGHCPILPAGARHSSAASSQ